MFCATDPLLGWLNAFGVALGVLGAPLDAVAKLGGVVQRHNRKLVSDIIHNT